MEIWVPRESHSFCTLQDLDPVIHPVVNRGNAHVRQEVLFRIVLHSVVSAVVTAPC